MIEFGPTADDLMTMHDGRVSSSTRLFMAWVAKKIHVRIMRYLKEENAKYIWRVETIENTHNVDAVGMALHASCAEIAQPTTGIS